MGGGDFLYCHMIRHIIFDLGNVLMKLDYTRTEKAFIDLGVNDFRRYFTLERSMPFFKRFEMGQMAPEVFYDGVREMTGLSAGNEQLKEAWNAMLVGFPAEWFAWLEKLAAKYPVYLFSNTNQVHFERVMEMSREQMQRPLNSYFTQAWFSHQVGVRKPDEEAYNTVLALGGLRAGDSLFIDDVLENVTGARKAGLQAIHLPPPLTVLDLDKQLTDLQIVT